MYVEKMRYENLQHGYYRGEGIYDIPKLIGSSKIGAETLKDIHNRRDKR